MVLNETHDPNRRSWIDSANEPNTDFPIQNLPFCIFSSDGHGPRGGIEIGDQIFDLKAAFEAELFSGAAAEAAQAASGQTLNALMAMGPRYSSALRTRVSQLLSSGKESEQARSARSRVLVPMAQARLEMPAFVRSYTDFSCSINHMTRMSGGNLRPVFFHIPVGYNGRASSLRLTGAPVVRPYGQFTKGEEVAYGPEPRMDFELEFAAFVGTPNDLSQPVSIAEAADHIFGFVLLNDWSARGIQFFESMLGPFLGKSFLTTISPWVVTQEALAPFRLPAVKRKSSEVPTPAYLYDEKDQGEGGMDIELTAFLQTEKMRREGLAPARIVTANFAEMYWNSCSDAGASHQQWLQSGGR